MKPIDRTIEVIGTLIDIVDRAEWYDSVDDVDVIPLWHDELVTIKGNYYRVWSFIGDYTSHNKRIEFDDLDDPRMGSHRLEEVPMPTQEDGNVSVIKLNRDSMVRIDGYNYKAEELL